MSEPTPPQPADPRPARWPARSAASSLALILGVAILLRALVLLEVWDSPVLYLHHWTETDNAFYDLWARQIVAGDLLSVHDVRPYHSWHGHVARAAYEASGGPEPMSEAVGRRIWDEWLGPRTFYQDPLYSYFLALLYRTLGHQVRLVFLAQAMLGLLSITLLWAVARRLGGETVALVAGLVGALYGPLVLYEDVLLRVVLINVTGIATLWLAMRAFRRPSAPRFALVGLAGALGVLATSGAWPFVLLVAAFTPIALRQSPRQALRAVGALSVGLLLGLTPVVARNLAVGVAPFSLASSGAITFVNHNAADYQPTSGTAMSAYAAEVMRRSGGRMLPAIAETLHTHPSLGSWLALLGRKFLAVWHWYEIPNNESYDYFLLHAPALRAVGLGFGLVAPLALVGLLLGFRRSWEYALTVAYLGCGLMSLVVLYTVGRLRMPMAFALIPFAAVTLVGVARFLAARRDPPSADGRGGGRRPGDSDRPAVAPRLLADPRAGLRGGERDHAAPRTAADGGGRSPGRARSTHPSTRDGAPGVADPRAQRVSFDHLPLRRRPRRVLRPAARYAQRPSRALRAGGPKPNASGIERSCWRRSRSNARTRDDTPAGATGAPWTPPRSTAGHALAVPDKIRRRSGPSVPRVRAGRVGDTAAADPCPLRPHGSPQRAPVRRLGLSHSRRLGT